jgi:hypothetical protein
VFALLAFAAGFIVRPFGALVFGSLGDMNDGHHRHPFRAGWYTQEGYLR